MTVAQNLAFGLKLRGAEKSEIRRRVGVAAATLGLEDYLERKPGALSGGQRQRVSNLDAQLRVQVRAEIQKLQRTLGVTTIYVTHDQTEAMTMGDRIAVMRDGTLQQVDRPERVYQRPANRFVAGFIGSPTMNMVSSRLSRTNGNLTVGFGENSFPIDDEVIAERPSLRAYEGKDLILGIRPEDFEDAAFVAGAPPDRTITTVVSLREALGSEVLVHFPLGDASSTLIARVDPQTAAREGEPLRLVVDTRRLHFFEPESGLAIA
jgi:multiple sugar transport system ATP-binding protein